MSGRFIIQQTSKNYQNNISVYLLQTSIKNFNHTYMKKIFLTVVILFAIVSLNAQQTYIKYEFMKQLPGQNYEKLEQSWVNYHKELMNAGIINVHRVWKVLPGNNVDFDYIVMTSYNNYADALGIGKSISVDDFKSKYPEDYKVMSSSTYSTRTMVRDLILKLDLGISDPGFEVIPGKSVLNMIFVKSKNEKYDAAEMKFSKKWHQFAIDKKRKDAFYFSHTVGSGGINIDISNIISHLYKNIDQLTNATTDDIKFTPQEQTEFNQLLNYRDLTKSLVLLNVMNLEKP